MPVLSLRAAHPDPTLPTRTFPRNKRALGFTYAQINYRDIGTVSNCSGAGGREGAGQTEKVNLRARGGGGNEANARHQPGAGDGLDLVAIAGRELGVYALACRLAALAAHRLKRTGILVDFSLISSRPL